MLFLGEQFVIRDCYDAPGNDTTPEGFLACHDLMKVGDLCYCNKDNCNGQGHIAASGLLAAVAVIAASVSRWQWKGDEFKSRKHVINEKETQ